MAKKQRTKGELEKLRDTAEDMFIRLNMTGRDISDRLDITEQTISNWRKGREGERSWDDRKRDLQLTPVKLKELLMNEAHKVVQGEKSEINADQISKFMAVIDRLDKTINPRVVMAVLQGFDNFMADTDPAMAVKFTEYHKMYLQHLITLEA